MNKTIIVAFATSILLAFTVRAQNLIRNGDFELPAVSANSFVTGTPSDWSFTISEGFIFNGNGGDENVWPLPQHGQQYVYIGNESGSRTLNQTFTITNVGNSDFALVWHDSSGHVESVSGSPYTVQLVNNTAGNTTVFSGGYDAYHEAAGEWGQISNALALTAGTYTISFAPAGSDGGLGTLIDNVSVIPVPGADVTPDIRLAVQIAWAGRTNVMYQLQFVTSLADTNWVNFGAPSPGTGTNALFDVIVGTTQRFYRVVRVP